MRDIARKWYLAGPMTGLPEFNFPQFASAKADLEEIGFEILSPHTIDHGETPETLGKLHYSVYLRAGFKMLLECQGIILLPNWTRSRGAQAEFNLAVSLDMAVMQYEPENGGLVVIA